MNNTWNRYDTLLSIVEELANYEGVIASEEELSKSFDKNIAEHVIAEYGEDDTIAINEEFSNYADSLVKDGLLHPEQYRHYEYVGIYS